MQVDLPTIDQIQLAQHTLVLPPTRHMGCWMCGDVPVVKHKRRRVFSQDREDFNLFYVYLEYCFCYRSSADGDSSAAAATSTTTTFSTLRHW